MAKISMIERNKKRIRLSNKFRAKREDLKKQAQAAYAEGEIPWEILHKLQTLPKNSYPTRIQRRCGICGRPHAVYKKFELCRLCLRKYVMKGHVPGLRKASW